MPEINIAIKVKPSQPKKALAIPLGVEPSPLKIRPLDEFLKKFEIDFGDLSRFDKNNHTATLSDTCLSYDTRTKLTYLIAEKSTLTIPFLCISLIKHIKNMDVPCAYSKEILPFTNQNSFRWIPNDRLALGLFKEIVNNFESLEKTQYLCTDASLTATILKKYNSKFQDWLIHWNTPCAPIIGVNGEKQSLAESQNSVFSELSENVQVHTHKESIRSQIRHSENSFKTIKHYVTSLKNQNQSLTIVGINLIIDVKDRIIGLDDATQTFTSFKHSLRRNKYLGMKGYIWKLERSFDDHFYYHCIFFLKTDESMNTDELAKIILQTWNEKIYSSNSVLNLSTSNQSTYYKDVAAGNVNSSDDYTYDQLFDFIRYHCKKDQFIIHKCLFRKKTFDTGRLPSIRKHLGRLKSI